jgi:UBA/TS-N domain
MSGFSHFDLEAGPLGKEIAWYNAQFYNGWGDAHTGMLYKAIVACGWRPERVCLGVLTNPGNGPRGHVSVERLKTVVSELRREYGESFGGVMGWEYANAGCEREGRENWEWVKEIGAVLRLPPSTATEPGAEQPAVTPITEGLQQATLSSTTPPGSTARNEQQAAVAPFPEEHITRLVELGFEQPEAIAALEAMDGNVDAAAALLFGDDAG